MFRKSSNILLLSRFSIKRGIKYDDIFWYSFLLFCLFIFVGKIISTNCFLVSYPYLEHRPQEKPALTIILTDKAK